MKFQPHEYQRFGIEWLIQRTILDGEEGGAYFLDPGLGKSVMTLCWVQLLRRLGLGNKTLIVAPLRVCYSTWPRECAKWDQFKQLKCSIVHGTDTQRMAALSAEADLYLINPEGLVWLLQYYDKRPIPFDTLVVDESSKFKNWGAKRTKALRKLVPKFKRRLILTGTPSPNSLEDLFPQVYIVDSGKALGTAVTKFRTRYFYRGGFGGYGWKAVEGAQASIEAKINHLCLRLSAADHLDMPELLVNDVWVDLPAKTLKDYKQLEREMFLALDEAGGELILPNAGAKYLTCKQLAGGGVYDADKKPVHIHTAKVEAAMDLIDELQGKPVLIAFQFKHDLERLRKVLPKMPSIDGSVSAGDADKLIEKWNRGELLHLAVQPQALSHGINMQSGPGRDIIWFGLTDNLEIYLQFNARVWRQGVTGQVRLHRILANRTVDVAVVERIETKDQSQQSLLDALNKYRKAEEA